MPRTSVALNNIIGFWQFSDYVHISFDYGAVMKAF